MARERGIRRESIGRIKGDAVGSLCNDLHEAVVLHRLLGIHRMKAGCVEAGQPHVPHDDDLEGVLRVLELVRQVPPLLLVADVLLPLGAILGEAEVILLDHPIHKKCFFRCQTINSIHQFVYLALQHACVRLRIAPLRREDAVYQGDNRARFTAWLRNRYLA